jgi:hypothetical protein
LTGHTAGGNGEAAVHLYRISDRDQLGDATWLALFEWLGSEKEVEIVSDPATKINVEFSTSQAFDFSQ